MRTEQEIADEIAAVSESRKKLDEHLRLLRTELDEVKLAKASHPWLGKRVKYTDRQVIRSYGYHSSTRYREVTFRGTVTVHNGREHQRITGLRYHRAGDIVVISDTGKKGYGFSDKWELDES